MPMYEICQMCGNEREILCINCRGTGRKNGRRCRICHGKGKKICPECKDRGRQTVRTIK